MIKRLAYTLISLLTIFISILSIQLHVAPAMDWLINSYRFEVCYTEPLTVTSEGSANSASSTSTLATTATIDAAVGDWLVAVVAADNTGASGIASLTGISNTSGNVWVERAKITNSVGSTAAGGATVGIYTLKVDSAVTSQAVTANFSPNTTSKAIQIYRVVPGSGDTVQFVAADTTGATGNATTHTGNSVSVNIGELIFGGVAIETGTPSASGDADTSNGNWSTAAIIVGNTGTDATSMNSVSQYKTVTATASQTYDPSTTAARDSARSYLIIKGCSPTPPPPPASVSWAGATFEDSNNLTTYTSTAHATGTAAADRKTIVLACGEDTATDFSITSITVSGSTNPVEVLDTATVSIGSLVVCGIWIFDNPSGTTADVAVTFSEAQNGATIDVFAAYGLTSSTATDTANVFDTDAGTINGNTDIQAGGIAVGVCATTDESQSMTWTGLTERSEFGTNPMRQSGADTAQTTAQTPLSITCAVTSVSDSVLQVAAFR